MKRILSILLVLAMLLSMIPAVFAANCDITVSTPAPDPVKVGALYQLPLGTVFTDPNGHALSFALKADYGDKVYIKDNTLQFTSAEAGEFRIGITATCTDGGSAEAVVPITVEAVEDGGKNQYGYDETDQASVTVYVTISSDGAPIIGKDDGGTILSHLEVKVPYFPLSLYGLDDFNRYHTENGSGSYTDNEIVQRPTLLHLYIYMLERYYLGVAEKNCGKGTSGLLEFTGSGEGVDDMLGGSYEDTRNALLISGSATSMYMQNFWGHDENLMYYRNHVYPLMSAGWGSTADYILLSDNDTIDLAMFSNWSFWTYGAFARFDKDDYTAKVGEKITFETQKYDTKSVSDGGTESFEPITGLNVKLYNENWEQQQELTSEGSSYTLDTASLKAGTYYLLGYDPNYGTEDACYAPATAKIVLSSGDAQPCQWNEGVITTEPTCTTAGVKTFSCSVHGETRTEELPALGHTFGADGACIRCGEKDPAIPTQDESGVYGIASEKQLQWFAAKVNGGDTAISGKLTANIELTEAWTPMGSQKQPFTGSFDGDGHSITGMSITFDSNDKSVGAPYLGLFGYVKGTADKKAEIRNLTLSGKLDITENYRNSYAYSGGLVGGAEYVSFTNITTNVTITAKKGSAPYPWSYVGGFAGIVKNADFLRCVNNGTVTTDGDYVSGFAAKSETTTYTSCVNNGAITGRTKIGGFGASVKSTKAVDSCNTGAIGLAAYNGSNQGIGGLFGEIGYGSTLTRCYNTGAVTGDCYVGGLVGSVGSGSDAANGPSYIVDSYNSGAITGHSDKSYCGIGGLVGNLNASSSRVYEQSYVHNCYNVGTVTDLGLKTINAGAAIGLMHADYSTGSYLEVENVYYLACGLEGLGKMNYSTMHDPSVFAEMTAEAMKASDFVTKLGASFKADGTCMQKVNSGYPVLTWQQLGEGQSEHTFKVTATVDATCTEAGSKTYTCTACGETKAEEIPALGHNVGEGGICSRCGEKIAYLSALRLTAYNASGDYVFTPEFDGKTAEYQVAVPDADGFSAFLWATLSENAPEGSTIKAEWTNLYNGKTQSTAITSGKTSGQSLANFSRDAKPNTVTLTVGVDGNTQTYTLTSFRTPTLSALNVTGARMNETFSHRTAEYTIDTTADSITLSATPYQDGYTVTYNGAESGEWTLQDGENVMTVVVSNADGLSTSYTVKATKHAICKVRAELDPENALLVLYDSFNTSIYPDENGDYTLMDGAAYTYVATAKGYVGKSGSLTASAAEPVLKITLTAAEENTTLVKDLPAEWPNFRNGSDHLGITNAPTPYTSEDSELLWAAKYGTGWAAAPGSPILVDGGLITYTGSTIKRLDVNTGKVLAEGTMAGTSSFSINPATYADGMIFVGLSGGKIQAFNAKTLESLWIYTDPLGGQPNTSPTYHDGYIYVGFWNGESKPGNFVAISVTDEDPMKTDEAKLASWSYACVGGFYWAGAYVTDNLCIVGTDDGSGEGDYINTSALLVFDRLTGKLLDSHYGCKGDIRSNVSHDPDSDRVFFTSKGGYIYNAAIDWETGRITDFKSLALKDAEGYTSEEKPGAIMSTCTPSVYNGRIYLGVSGNKGQFSQNGGHCIEVIDLDTATGEMSYAYSYGIIGYPQTSAMVSTAYVDKDFDGDGAGDGYVFIYLPYNYTPGGISVLMDRPGQTEPKTATDSGYSEIFTPQAPLAQYCICSTIADSTGTIYYKNDSCYMMAITSKILSIEVTENPEKMTYKAGETFDASGMKVVAKLANGLERDITNYVTWQEGPIEQGQTSIILSYTYGFDSANYGLKTKTAKLELDVLPSQDEDGVYLIGNASQLLWFASKVNSGETGISGKLTANIDLTSVESWTPIGSLKQPFTGSFDGDGHSITGMSITFDSDDKSIGAPYLGLFGYVKGTADKKAEIKNLTLTGKLNITENYRNSYAYSGGLVGGAEYVSFTDVTVDVAVTAKQGTAPYPWSYVGGFAGTVKNADFLRCVNNGSVTSDGDYVSGFAALSEKTTYTSCMNNGAITARTKVGGFGAEVKSTKATDCGNTGAISLVEYGTGKQAIGGLFAEIRYGSALTRCYNTGAVTGDCYVGGLVGSVGSSSDATNGPSYIVDSYNSGAITGHSDKYYCGIGGLVGKLDASSSRVYEQSYVHNCYNTGTVTDLGLKTAGNPGAAIGVMHADYSEGSYLEVKDVYYRACGLEGLGMMVYSTMHDPSVFVEMSAEAMKASGFVTKLGASFKADGTCMQKVNGGYPILVWQKLAEGQSEHTLEKTTVVAPTCTEQGYTIYTCTACGETVKADFVPANGHSYEESVVAPTCEKDGYTNHVCSVCGDSYRDNYVDAAGHQYTLTVTAPTCTAAGYTTHLCSVCGHSYVDSIVPATGHSYEDTVTAPTCTAAGYTTHTCSVCGDSYIDTIVPATGHDYVWQITRVPTCTAEGVKTFTCSHCGDSYDVALAKVDHTYEAVVTAPTCTNNGYTTHTCSVCGDSYVDSIVPATGHSYDAVVTAPTCTNAGYTTHTCSVCGDSYVDSIVPATGHSYEAVVTAPTCDKMGYTTYTCSVCGDSYVGSYTDALEHTYTAVVTKEPTCTEEGVKTFTCSECGKSYTEAIPTVAHSYEAVVTAPTCDKMGYTTYTCSACGDSYVADYVDAAGHDCETETVPATCLGYGFVRESCKHCDYSVITEITAPLGHDYQAVVTAPTLDEGGYTTHTCSRCGDSYVDSETPALGHKCAAYTDIPTDWAKEGICFVIENGLMVGTTSTTFAPKDTLTRAMLVTVLYRMAGSPAVDAPSGFTDVADGQWYSDAIAWAAANGIVNGVGGNKFAPSEPVTREQLAAIFFRYAKAEAPEADVLSGYPDAESVSTYARDAMAWAVSTGLVTGSKEADGTYLAPQGLAAREQAAAILMRYVKANA